MSGRNPLRRRVTLRSEERRNIELILKKWRQARTRVAPWCWRTFRTGGWRPSGLRRSFTQEFLIHILESIIPASYVFVYMPVDFDTNCNLGFGYVSVSDLASLVKLYECVGAMGDAVRRRCIWRNGRRPPARRRAKWCMRAFRAIGTWDAFARTGRWCSYLKSIIPSSLSAKMSWSMGIPRWFWRDWSDLTGPNRIIRKQRSFFGRVFV